MIQKFCNISEHTSLCHKAVQDALVSSIILVTHALLHSMCDLKAAQINMQCSLIQELILYKFKRGLRPQKQSKTFVV